MIKISPSILACDFTKLGEEVADIERNGADMVHLDVMDGMFVKNISFGVPVIASLRPKSELVFDVHLMIEEPVRYIETFAKAGADYITVHIEACSDVKQTLEAIHAQGKKAGLSVKPMTPVSDVYPYLDMLDIVLIMTVEPGHGGQKLIPEMLDKVRELKEKIKDNANPPYIEVDGGITEENAEMLRLAGANVLVAGSSVFRASDRQMAMNALRG